jgi:hypothetical protein
VRGQAEIAIHGEGRKADIDAVDVAEDVKYETIRDQPEIGFAHR